MSVFDLLKQQFKRIVFLERLPEIAEVILTQRRVFTLPNKAGLLFGGMLLLLFITSTNYNINLGFVMTFILASVGLVNAFFSFRNLAYLHLSATPCAPVFAGETAQFSLHINNPSQLHRYALWIGFARKDSVEHAFDVASHDRVVIKVNQISHQRGLLPIARLRLHTSFPLGLIHTWSTWLPDVKAVVFPAPEHNAPPLPITLSSDGDGSHAVGDEDFSGVRSYQLGDPLKHISWKHSARVDLDAGGTLVTKQFSGGNTGELMLDFDTLPKTLDIELRLSRLTQWIIEANTKGVAFGFKLGNIEYPSAHSEQHRLACLTALAMYSDVTALEQSSS